MTEHLDPTLDEIQGLVLVPTRQLAQQGMEAVETIHGSHDTDMVHRLTRMADRVGLLTTGGSDYHGPEKGTKLGLPGGRAVPAYFLDEIVQRVERRGAKVTARSAA